MTPRPDNLLMRVHAHTEYPVTYMSVELEATGVVIFESAWLTHGERRGVGVDDQIRLVADVFRGRATVQLW